MLLYLDDNILYKIFQVNLNNPIKFVAILLQFTPIYGKNVIDFGVGVKCNAIFEGSYFFTLFFKAFLFFSVPNFG